VQYKSKERSNLGHLKRWKDQLHLQGLGTGAMPIPSEFMIMKWKWNCRWVYRGGFCLPDCRTRTKPHNLEAEY